MNLIGKQLISSPQVKSKGLNLTVAYVEGDNCLGRAYEMLGNATEVTHLDGEYGRRM